MWNRSAAHTNNVFRLDRHIDAERKNEKKKTNNQQKLSHTKSFNFSEIF